MSSAAPPSDRPVAQSPQELPGDDLLGVRGSGRPAGISSAATDHVWLVTSGYYEDYHVDGVYATLDRAVAGIKATFGDPYRVTWEDVKGSDDGYVLVGHFEHVTGYSIEHTANYEITRTEVA